MEILRDVWMSGGRDEDAIAHLTLSTPLFQIQGGSGEEALGLDSLDALEVALQLEESFGILVADDVEPSEIRTPGSIAALVERLTSERP